MGTPDQTQDISTRRRRRRIRPLRLLILAPLMMLAFLETVGPIGLAILLFALAIWVCNLASPAAGEAS